MRIRLIGIIFISMLMLSACSHKEETDKMAKQATEEEVVISTEEKDATNESAKEKESVNEEKKAETDTPEEAYEITDDFTLLDSQGKEVSLSDYSGKIVFLNFFTTWCKYCKVEMPEFQKAYEKYGDDIEILLVNVTQQEKISEEEIVKWYDDLGLTMPMVLDTKGELTSNYAIRAFPTTFFIGKNREMLAYYPGAMSEELIDQVIEEFVEKD